MLVVPTLGVHVYLTGLEIQDAVCEQRMIWRIEEAMFKLLSLSLLF